MPDEILVFDHASDGGVSPFAIGGGTSYALVSASFPAAPLNVLYASSIDTEGAEPVSRKWDNRTISLEVEIADDAAGTLLKALQVKFAKLQAEGGTFRRVLADGTTTRTFDLHAADGWNTTYDFAFVLGNLVTVTMTFPARPVSRGAAVTQADRTETTLPALIATETGITGDVSALGSLVIDNDASADWWGVTWGLETNVDYAFTDSTGSGALLYQCESRTVLNGATIVAGPAGASGTGSNVVRHTALATIDKAILSTQASGGGAHLSHVGTFRVYARMQAPTTNSGNVSVALEWGMGDFRRFTQNTRRSIPVAWRGYWVLADLGLVNIAEVPGGTQRFEGRVIAKSDFEGDDLDLDCLVLIPALVSGVAEAVSREPTISEYAALDSFTGTTAGGALNARTAPLGGAWATSGVATDFAFADIAGALDGEAISRSTGVEASSRYAILGANLTNTVASMRFLPYNGAGLQGLNVRWTDANNRVSASASSLGSGDFNVVVNVVVGGAVVAGGLIGAFEHPSSTPKWMIMRCRALTNGDFTLEIVGDDPTGAVSYGQTLFTYTNRFSQLATGGTLASGKAGVLDQGGSGAGARYIDEFSAYAPPVDAAVYGGQSLTVRHDAVIREDSAGAIWQAVSSYVGDHLRVPPAGAEGHSDRFIVKPFYSAETNGVRLDDRIDDLSGRLTYTPRYVT